MIKEFEYKGIWWLPNRPSEQVSGILRFTPDKGAKLELIGSFNDIEIFTNKILVPEIILGFSEKKITLYKCFEAESILSFTGFQTSSFYADTVFVGAHFQKSEDIKFKSISVDYLHLDEWVNISGFDVEPPKEEVIIKYKSPEPFQFNISDELKISIYFQDTGPILLQKEATIKQKTKIKIETSEDKPFEDYRKIIHHIQNFLTLAIQEPVYPLAIMGITEEMVKNETYYPPVEVFYRPPDIHKRHEPLLLSMMLFTFRDISDRFESFLRNWFEKMDLLEPVYNLYFGAFYNPRIYLEHQFLSLIQAIESYHQRTYGGKYISDEDYKVVYDALVNAIPEGTGSDLKDRLKEYLKYGNEFSLRKRLKEIFDKYQEILDRFIENKKTFIDKVVNTRNYLTHYDEELKERTVDREDLYRLTQKLKMCLEICLLTELGFSSEEIKALFSRNIIYRQSGRKTN